ncbi:NAD(+) kinase, partial [Bacillus safensis]
MKFAVSSKGNSVSDTLKSKIQTYLLDFGMELNEEEPDLVIT